MSVSLDTEMKQCVNLSVTFVSYMLKVMCLKILHRNKCLQGGGGAFYNQNRRNWQSTSGRRCHGRM